MIESHSENYIEVEKKLSNFIALQIYLPVAKFCIIQSIPGLVEYNTFANYCVGVVFLLYFLTLLRTIKSRSGNVLFFSLLIFIILHITAFFRGGDNSENLQERIVRIWSFSFASFVVVSSIKNYDIFLSTIVKWAPIAILFCLMMLINTMLFGAVGSNESTYNMSLSGFCLIPTMLSFLSARKDNKILGYVFFAIGILVILAMGSRGPLISIFIFVFLLQIKNMKFTDKNVIWLILISIISIALIVNSHGILQGMNDFLNSVGIQSRTLNKILYGGISDDSGRGELISYSLDMINKNFWGIGFMGYMGCHNTFIENILWFGVLIGSCLDIFLIIVIIKTIFSRCRLDNSCELLTLCFFSHAAPRLVLNTGTWEGAVLWVFLALALFARKGNINHLPKGITDVNYITKRIQSGF